MGVKIWKKKNSGVSEWHRRFKEGSNIEFTYGENAYHFLRYQGFVHFEFTSHGQTVNRAYYAEILKRLREVVRIKRPELWPNYWILHHDNAPAHKALSVKQFLAQNSITETEHSSYSPDLAQNDLWLFPKIKLALRRWRFQDTEDVRKMWWRYWKLFHNRSSKNVSNSGSIVGLSV
jgi:hypothetical protein